jgi:hypothetical protein
MPTASAIRPRFLCSSMEVNVSEGVRGSYEAQDMHNEEKVSIQSCLNVNLAKC